MINSITDKKDPGRPGITKRQVVEAAIALFKAGFHDPKPHQIRHALGETGSFATIHKFLQEWRAECTQIALEGKTSHSIDFPAPLQQTLIEIWENLQAASQAETLQVRETAATTVMQAEQEKENAITKATALEVVLKSEQLQVNHLQADLKLKTDEWKIEREQRIALEARTQESEKNLQHLQEETNKRFAELERSHQETLEHFKHQQGTTEKAYQKDIDEFKTLLENQRQKYIVEVDRLNTAKNKLEQEKSKLAVELEQKLKRYQILEERARGLEFDLQVARQNHQANEKELIVLQTEMKQKETVINELKAQVGHWQQKFETATEHIGQLKAQLEKQK